MKFHASMRLILLACLFAGILSSCSHNRAVSALDSSLDSLFTSIFPDPEAPGAIVLVAKGDTILFDRGYGMADLKNGKAICDTTLFNICSISKQFAAVALLKLEEQDKLKLDDHVSKFIPALRLPQFSEVTLFHLLSHTSGIPNSRPRTDEEWAEYVKHHETSFGSCRDYKLYSLTAESVRYMADVDTLVFEPGTGYEYQNPTYQLVLPIIEDVTRERFNPWMKANIFDVAGLKHTVYFDPVDDLRALSHGYIPAEGENTYKLWRSPDGKWEDCDYGEAFFFPTKTDGGIYTSALDFLKWKKALYSGKVIGDSALHKAITPVIETDIPMTSYGLGLFIEQVPGKARKIFHTGDNGGYLTVEAYFPEHDVYYLIFANRPDWPREKTYEQVDSILHAYKFI